MLKTAVKNAVCTQKKLDIFGKLCYNQSTDIQPVCHAVIYLPCEQVFTGDFNSAASYLAESKTFQNPLYDAIFYTFILSAVCIFIYCLLIQCNGSRPFCTFSPTSDYTKAVSFRSSRKLPSLSPKRRIFIYHIVAVWRSCLYSYDSECCAACFQPCAISTAFLFGSAFCCCCLCRSCDYSITQLHLNCNNKTVNIQLQIYYKN